MIKQRVIGYRPFAHRFTGLRRSLVAAVTVLSVGLGLESSGFSLQAGRVVSVWYRGNPPGVPRRDDLAALRAAGFSAVTWPARELTRAAELRKLADELGLAVVMALDPVPLTPFSASAPGPRMDLRVNDVEAAEIPAMVWRAIAHGAHVVSFDPGQARGTGLTDALGTPRSWVRTAAAIARQLAFNARLFAAVQPGPNVVLDRPVPAGLDVVFLDAGRAWMIVATNTSAQPVKAAANFPARVPPALWTDLLDGTSMSMLSRPDGPRWTFELEPGAARVYIIDK